ncbi:MAG: PocR ligand-binding domain-containing protein [Oscillospiraceae bacterium]|nr:PocR ligand-binding domain-containing protein [Oscillospiraceae bacterium]
MNILFNNEELLRLITNLYTLTGIRANILDLNGNDICLADDHLPFCAKINACPEGHTRCVNCDVAATLRCMHQSGVHFYRCHAGICEAIFPIFSGGKPLAFLVFGQYLDTTSIQTQWETTKTVLDWYPEGADTLRDAFFSFRQYTSQEITAYAEILQALAKYIQLTGAIRTSEYTDLQRLEIYINQHYTENISLSSISKDLGISRTKLCSMAKKLFNGKTISRIVAERRISAAKDLLVQDNMPISVVAESVGITDYNYFTKVFRSITGTTPSEFRKQHRHNAKNSVR